MIDYRRLGPNEAVQSGDLIMYGKDYDGNGRLNILSPEIRARGNAISEANHTGIVKSTDNRGHATEIESKWGSGPKYRHPPRDVPSEYGPIREYWRKVVK